ncbi:MAG: DNA circularization N-terminal domain-containing protein [Candidatus Eremiobacteraeota bacterium]|nr:DNA circularization N-terminal domain-containing protein [Candidatus Eremiobacteraeota bacterium]
MEIGHLTGGVAGGLGPWADAPQRAWWRGVPFAVRASQIRRGRRIVVHEHPFRDDVWVGDLGRFSRASTRSTPPRAR